MMDLKKSINLMKEIPSIEEGLEKIYASVSSGQCQGCLKCCTESVNTFFVEFVDILSYLQGHPQLLESHAEKISRFFLLEMLEQMYCPFVTEEGQCAIYPVRPLPCRLFGHLEETDYNQNYDAVLKNNEDLAIYYKETYALILPSETINRKIPYCENFVSEQKVTRDDRDDLVDCLFSLDSRFLMNECIGFEDVNQSLITWFFKSIMSIEDASVLRVNGMRLYQEKKMDELELLISKITEKIIKLNSI